MKKGTTMNEPEPRHGLHVLVAEDSPTQAELLRQALADAGYAVSVAANGLDALASARSMRPAVVITDVLMPDMDGYQLCRAIKTDPALHDVPVMLVTSLQGIDDIVTALESGADNFIRKPFDNDSLLARLDFLLANRKLRAQRRLQSGIEISLGGRRHLVTASREQILDLLFSSYEEALQANQELRARQQEVQGLNLQLATRAVELEDANAQLRSFSHCVSHDLRSPLATISGFSTLLLQKHASGLDPRAVHFLQAIQQETGRMVRIVEDVLHLAGIERANVTRTEVDLAAQARAAIASLRQAQPDREVLFDCPAAATAACDERLVRIALANLLGNAWKFTGKRAPARIAFRALEGGTVFCVEDNGAGFDMAQAHRLFKPFERLHRSEDFQGFGIGLATVQRVVALHGGRVWAESAPGEGARFCFTLQPERA
jgi:signal transduction histidine kinase